MFSLCGGFPLFYNVPFLSLKSLLKLSFLTTVDYKICRALAKNCDAPIDNKKGAEAKDWRKGKPVRVVRNCKGRKHSKYAPEEGNRYDGIYKVKFLSYNFNNTQLKNDATIL